MIRSGTFFYISGTMVLSCLAGSGCSTMRSMGGFGERLADVTTGSTPKKFVLQMDNQQFPDERRQGINELVERSWGKAPPYTTQYRDIAQTDTDSLVRATAIRALNRSRDPGATPLFIKALADENVQVRLEGAKALANLPDPNATPALIQIVRNENENRDVRIAAADALRHYRSLEVARILIAQLGAREFGVAWQSRQSLKILTGGDLSFDESSWLNFVTGPTKPFG